MPGGRVAASFLPGFVEDVLAGRFEFNTEVFEDSAGDALALAQHAQQHVFCAYIAVSEQAGFLRRQRQGLLEPRGVRGALNYFLVRSCYDAFFNFCADRLKVDATLRKYSHGSASAQGHHGEQEMLGADKVVVETMSFLVCQTQRLLGLRSEARSR